jgi:hypothetical protein
VDWREGELEAAARSSGEPASGLLRYMSGMIVENQLNRSAGRIGGIKESEEFDELAAAARLSTDALLPASLMLARCGQSKALAKYRLERDLGKRHFLGKRHLERSRIVVSEMCHHPDPEAPSHSLDPSFRT